MLVLLIVFLGLITKVRDITTVGISCRPITKYSRIIVVALINAVVVIVAVVGHFFLGLVRIQARNFTEPRVPFLFTACKFPLNQGLLFCSPRLCILQMPCRIFYPNSPRHNVLCAARISSPQVQLHFHHCCHAATDKRMLNKDCECWSVASTA